MFEQCFGLLFKRLNSGFAVCSNKVFEQCLNVETNTLITLPEDRAHFAFAVRVRRRVFKRPRFKKVGMKRAKKTKVEVAQAELVMQL